MRTRLGLLALAAAGLSPLTAAAGGVAGAGGKGRVVEETVLVVWDHASGVEHALIAAKVAVPSGSAAYLASIPGSAEAGPPLAQAVAAFARLSPEALPLPSRPGPALSLVSPGSTLEGACKEAGVRCDAVEVDWAERAGRAGKTVLVLPLPPPDPGGLDVASAYAHVTLASRRPVLPFAEPLEPGYVEPEPPPPSKEHPPRVRVWVELGRETRDGRWERKMDGAADEQVEALSSCYSPALLKAPRLSGDVHAAIKVLADGSATPEDSRASSKPLEAVARCFAVALAKAKWPPSPFGAPAPLEVHATVRPPAAVPRVWRAIVLSSMDVEAKLGSDDEPRVPPDTRVVKSLEPAPAELSAAFEPATRAALGIDVSRRWRLVVLESGADPHPPADDVVMRPFEPIPPPRPGEAPVPVIARGDRPIAPPPRRPRLWQRRRFRGAMIALALGALAAGAFLALRAREQKLRGA